MWLGSYHAEAPFELPLAGIDAVLVGDGWPIFRGGAAALRELIDSRIPPKVSF